MAFLKRVARGVWKLSFKKTLNKVTYYQDAQFLALLKWLQLTATEVNILALEILAKIWTFTMMVSAGPSPSHTVTLTLSDFSFYTLTQYCWPLIFSSGDKSEEGKRSVNKSLTCSQINLPEIRNAATLLEIDLFDSVRYIHITNIMWLNKLLFACERFATRSARGHW